LGRKRAFPMIATEGGAWVGLKNDGMPDAENPALGWVA